MNFEALRSQADKYKADIKTPTVAAQLKILISRHGYDIFKNSTLLLNELNLLQLPQNVKSQLCLIFQCSNISDYLINAKIDFNFIDVDNVIHNAVVKSGLSYGCVIKLVTDIFYACGLDFTVEYGPQLTDNNIEYKLHAIMPSDMADNEAAKAESLIRDYQNAFVMTLNENLPEDEKNANELKVKLCAEKAINTIYSLCAAGVPKGFYLLGRCYLYGDYATAVDFPKAADLMKLASERGVLEATASLADIYYMSGSPFLRDYTLAHHYYTRPGALAMGKKRQTALQDIYRQRNVNTAMLVYGVILIVIMTVFISLFHVGLFSGVDCLKSGITLTILSVLTCATGIGYHIRKKYNSIRVVIAVQYFIWVLYALILTFV